MNALSPAAETSRDSIPRAAAVIEGGIRVGLHRGAQIYVSIDGQNVANCGIGEARPGVPMNADSLVLWLSSCKPIGAAATLQLVERSQLELDAPVARVIPEFGQNGKEAITPRHILTHTAGFRLVALPWPPVSWEDTIERICAAKLERHWTPGEKAGYHAFSSWYILAELVRRLDGRDFSTYVRQEIFIPLGMNDSWIGMPPGEFDRYGDRMSLMEERTKSEPAVNRYDTPEGSTALVPGGNAHGPIRELGRFYEMLLAGGELAGERILSPESVRLMTTPQRVGMFDETFRHAMDWGLGMIIDSKQYGADTLPYAFGPHASPRSFGHGGAQSSIAYADPERRVVVAVAFNGMPGEAKHDARMRALLSALEEDLQLG